MKLLHQGCKILFPYILVALIMFIVFAAVELTAGIPFRFIIEWLFDR